jgi:hypothetical protein
VLESPIVTVDSVRLSTSRNSLRKDEGYPHDGRNHEPYRRTSLRR